MLVGAALLLVLGALSGIVLAYIVDRIGVASAAIAGAIFGLAMYVVDLYGVARLSGFDRFRLDRLVEHDVAALLAHMDRIAGRERT
jgi:hypothetical protein